MSGRQPAAPARNAGMRQPTKPKNTKPAENSAQFSQVPTAKRIPASTVSNTQSATKDKVDPLAGTLTAYYRDLHRKAAEKNNRSSASSISSKYEHRVTPVEYKARRAREAEERQQEYEERQAKREKLAAGRAAYMERLEKRKAAWEAKCDRNQTCSNCGAQFHRPEHCPKPLYTGDYKQ